MSELMCFIGFIFWIGMAAILPSKDITAPLVISQIFLAASIILHEIRKQ